MDGERDYLTIILGIIGLFSVGYAIKLNLEGGSGSLFYVFLIIQAVIVIYLAYVIVSKLLEEWSEYRWAPDRLR